MTGVVDWHQYLSPEHGQSWPVPLLERARSGAHGPARWLARAVPARVARVADISIGTNAVAEALARPGREVVRTATRTAVGEPPRLDLDDGAVGAVVSATGIGGPLSGEFFREVARVLAPGGAFAFLVPTVRPIRFQDVALLGQLGLQLGTLPVFPGMSELAGYQAYLEGSGLRPMEDARERYGLEVVTPADAELAVDSLFLPATSERRTAAVQQLLSQAARSPVSVPVPVRRVVLLK